MAKTRGGHNYRPSVRPSSPPPVGIALPTAGPSAAYPATVPAVDLPIPVAAGANEAPAPILTALAPCKYDMQVGPPPPSPPHSWPSQRAPPSKRARTSGPGESSSSRA